MFTMMYKRELTHMALGTSGRDCIMLQRAKLGAVLHGCTRLTPVTSRLPSKSF